MTAGDPGTGWRLRGAAVLHRLGWGHRGFRVESPRLAVLGLCLLLAIPFVLDQIAFQIRMREFSPDLRGWLSNSATLVANPQQPFYRTYGGFYLYPPFFLMLIWPLTRMSMPAAAAVFETAKWGALVVSLCCAWRLCARRGEDAPPVVALGSLLLTWRFIENDLAMGNINLLLLAAMLGSGVLLMHGRQFAAGFVISLAVCVKVTPALLLVYCAYKGWWRVLAGAAAGLAVCLVLWPASVLGWDNNWQLLHGWYGNTIAGFVERGAVRAEHANQALVGVLNRLFGAEPAFPPDGYLTILELPQRARDVVRATVALGVLGALVWACRRRVDPGRQPLMLASELSLVLIAMLLVSGLSWKAHFVTMLLPNAVLLAYLADARYATRRRAIGVLLLVSFVLCTLTSDVLTPRGADYAEALGLIALGTAIAAAGVWLVRGAPGMPVPADEADGDPALCGGQGSGPRDSYSSR